MNEISDSQAWYWDSVVDSKEFSHPLNAGWLGGLCLQKSKILDLGCGYGRTCKKLLDEGFENVVGADISARMLERARREASGASYIHLENDSLPFQDSSFDCVLLFAVLTCIPDTSRQQLLVREIERVLRPGGFLYLSDYPLQDDERNCNRYGIFAKEFGEYGIFKVDDGAVLRHHSDKHFAMLFSDFEIMHENSIPLKTMNGNPATIIQKVMRIQI